MASRRSANLSGYKLIPGQEFMFMILAQREAYSPAWVNKYQKVAHEVILTASASLTTLKQAFETAWAQVIECLLQSCTNANNEDDRKRVKSSVLRFCREQYSDYELYSFRKGKNNRVIKKIYQEIFKNLSEHDFAVDLTDVDNTELLHAAIASGSSTMIEKLLDNGADFNMMHFTCHNMIHFAVYHDQLEIVKSLINRGADLNAEADGEQVPLLYAIRNNSIAMTRLLLENGAKIADRIQLLNTAVVMGHRKIIDILFEHDKNIDVNLAEYHGERALHYTALRKWCAYCPGTSSFQGYDNLEEDTLINEKISIARFLLDAGADVDARCFKGYTTLHLAAKYGKVELVKTLLKHNASYDIKDDNGKQAIDIAIKKNHPKIVKILLKSGSDIGCYGSDTMTKEIKYIVQQHVKKSIVLDHVSDTNLAWFKNNIENSENILEKCQEEVVEMKKEMIGDSKVCYHDLLAKDINKLAMFTRNESIVDALESCDHYEKFPAYAYLIDVHFDKGLKRASLLNSSSRIIGSISESTGHELKEDVIEQVLSYMEKRDLKNLIEAWEIKK